LFDFDQLQEAFGRSEGHEDVDITGGGVIAPGKGAKDGDAGGALALEFVAYSIEYLLSVHRGPGAPMRPVTSLFGSVY